MSETKPCPFCEQPPFYSESAALCQTEGCCMMGRRVALSEWNRRAAPEPAPGDLPAVTGSEWTKFIPRAAAFFRDNGDVKLESEINDLACLLYQVARAGLPAPEPAPGDRERADLILFGADGLGNYTPTAGDVKTGFKDVNRLAAEFAKVREEQKEMDAKIADGMIDRNDAGKIDHDDIGSITALDIRDAIRKGEP